MKDKKIQFLRFVLFFSFLIFGAKLANAATFFVSPSSGDYTVGNILTVNVLINTEGVSVNNAEAVINFPSGLLEIVSISKSGSVFSLWVEEPTFSNNTGTLYFNGGLPTPGFTGNSGKILSIVFRVKKTGLASLIFSEEAVRANDGLGTNVFKSSSQAKFNFISQEKESQEKEPLIPVVGSVPSSPKISSSTHPDSNKWYSKNIAKFMWQTPSDIVAVRFLVDKNPNSQPKISYKSVISEKEITGLEDGVNYFHLQLKNKKGWGGVSHFQFQIDTDPPEPFVIKFVDGNETENQSPSVVFNTTDSLSGINYYKIKIGEGDFIFVDPETIKNNPYILPLQNIGKRNIIIQAINLF